MCYIFCKIANNKVLKIPNFCHHRQTQSFFYCHQLTLTYFIYLKWIPQSVECTRYEPETPNESMSKCQAQQFSTQVSLKNIKFGEENNHSTSKKPRELLTRDNDILLVQT